MSICFCNFLICLFSYYRFSGKKRRVMSKEKADYQKLLYKHKKEMKGALREIRRDKAFIGDVKIKEKLKRCFFFYILSTFVFHFFLIYLISSAATKSVNRKSKEYFQRLLLNKVNLTLYNEAKKRKNKFIICIFICILQ